MKGVPGAGAELGPGGLNEVSCEREALWARVWKSRCCSSGKERGIDGGFDAVLVSGHARYGGAR